MRAEIDLRTMRAAGWSSEYRDRETAAPCFNCNTVLRIRKPSQDRPGE